MLAHLRWYWYLARMLNDKAALAHLLLAVSW
jgi:hypothetical protein